MSFLQSTTQPSLPGSDTVQIDEDEFSYYPNRVFVNHVDQLHGKQIANILSQKIHHDLELEPFGEEEVMEEAEEASKHSMNVLAYTPIKQTYKIVGTLQNKNYRPPIDDISGIVHEEDHEIFIKEILQCGYIIFDITQYPEEIPKALAALKAIEKELDGIQEASPKKFKTVEQRVFVLISPIMTWARTRPIDPEEPEVPFTETDFKKRKAHFNYKAHIELEKEVLQKGRKYKDKLLTIVLATGLTYGEEEQDLHLLFKLAWQSPNYDSELPVIAPGNNIIPLLNVKDLVSILFALFEHVPKKSKYILAVEQTLSTQKQIAKAIARTLGNDRIKIIPKEEAFLYHDIEQSFVDKLTVNLRMEPGFIINNLDIPWKSDLNFCENIVKIVKEYKESRKLHPINMIIHGPPAVGKSTVARQLSEYFHIPQITTATLITETLGQLRSDIEYGKEIVKAKTEKDDEDDEEVEEEEEDEDDIEEKIEEWKEKLNELEKTLEANDGIMPEYILINLFREKLASNVCQNHGYILNDYPKTLEQALELFSFDEADENELEEEEEEGDEERPKQNIVPDFVIVLEASDEFLCNRIMHLEKIIEDTNYNEENMLRRLALFRTNNTEETTLLNVFDEHDIHPYCIDAETDDTNAIVNLIKQKIGNPNGYPLSDHELELILLEEEHKKMLELERQKKKDEEMKQKVEEDRLRNMERWSELLHVVQAEEQQLLAAQCKPLREYLIKFVFPTLTRGLLETARIKPDDPVDFLAEFLFKENPEGRMFDPTYIAAADEMFKVIEDYQEELGI